MNYQTILINDVPLIDVRAPVEFAQGAMPQAINLPLMNDEERAAVGTCYKQHGQEAAIRLGHQLVQGEIRDARLAQWREACLRQPQGYLCCARGGLRSHLVQQWLQESGIDYPLIEGGYKALRHCALTATDQLAMLPMVLIGGCTGSGKTLLVREQRTGIDLEGLAHHRGSSFGRTLKPQLAQASFENHLAATLLKQHQRWESLSTPCWVFEDEGRMIGSNHIPAILREQMARSPVVVVDDPFEVRLARLQQEYFEQMLDGFVQAYGEEQGWQEFAEYLHHGLFAIRRRLGLQRFSQLEGYLQQALQQHQQTGSSEAHFSWLAPLLKEYYDPMYRYQLEKKAQAIVFQGDYQQVTEWLHQRVNG